MRMLIILFLCYCNILVWAQDVKYYKLSRKIVNGQSSSSVSGGQFVAFSKNSNGGSICYESNKQGYQVNDSKLFCQSCEDGVYTYFGTSYWGSNTYFCFNSDKSVMNVTTPSGDTYIYKCSVAPSNVTTCSFIRNSTASGGNSTTAVPGYGRNISPYTPQHNGNTNSSSGNYGPKKKVEYYADCSFCYGTGRCKTCNGNGYYSYSFGSGYINCPNCKNPGNNSRRGNGVCAHCQNGKVKKHRYE